MTSELDRWCAQLPLVDHHCHGVNAYELEPDDIEVMATESDWPPPSGQTVFDSPIGAAIRAHCAPLLDLAPHCSGFDYTTRRRELGHREVSSRLLGATGIDTFLIDTGFHSTAILAPDDMRQLTGARAAEIVRLEPLAEALGREGNATDFATSFVEVLEAATRTAVGVKSIVAYRHGLDFDPSRPTPAAVSAAAGAWLANAERSTDYRLTDSVLLRHLLWSAVDLGKPIQLHVGYGDPDIVLHRCNPSHLTDFMQATRETGTQLMLLHCYPYIREAGILAQLFPHVWLDTSSAVTYAGASSTQLVRQSLEVAPFHKVLFASDAYGLPELYLCGSQLWRTAMRTIFGEWVDRGEMGTDDASRYVRMIARDNAVRAYALEDDR